MPRLAALALFLTALPGPASAGCVPTGDPILWRVEGGGAPSYFFGTIHQGVLFDDVQEAFPAAKRAFRQAKTLATEGRGETDTAPFELTAGTADQLLSKKAWAAAKKNLSFVPAEKLRRYKPWMLASLLSAPLAGDGIGMDDELVKYAGAFGKQLVSLETTKEVVDAFDRVPLRYSEFELETFEPDAARRNVETILRSYCSGDVELMRRVYAQDPNPENDAFLRAAVGGRNKAWLPKIEELLNQGGAFIAVGEAHLVVGPDDLLALLQAKGYRVSRVRADDKPAADARADVPRPATPALDQLKGLDTPR